VKIANNPQILLNQPRVKITKIQLTKQRWFDTDQITIQQKHNLKTELGRLFMSKELCLPVILYKILWIEQN
jgi:hypothetical protein